MRTDDIVRQRFAKVFRGYDVQEVDLFLDDVIREMDRLEQERNALLVRLEALLQELDRCDKLLYQQKEHELQQKEAEGLLVIAQDAVLREAPDAERNLAAEEQKPEEPVVQPKQISGADPKDKPNMEPPITENQALEQDGPQKPAQAAGDAAQAKEAELGEPQAQNDNVGKCEKGEADEP